MPPTRQRQPRSVTGHTAATARSAAAGEEVEAATSSSSDEEDTEDHNRMTTPSSSASQRRRRQRSTSRPCPTRTSSSKKQKQHNTTDTRTTNTTPTEEDQWKATSSTRTATATHRRLSSSARAVTNNTSAIRTRLERIVPFSSPVLYRRYKSRKTNHDNDVGAAIDTVEGDRKMSADETTDADAAAAIDTNETTVADAAAAIDTNETTVADAAVAIDTNETTGVGAATETASTRSSRPTTDATTPSGKMVTKNTSAVSNRFASSIPFSSPIHPRLAIQQSPATNGKRRTQRKKPPPTPTPTSILIKRYKIGIAKQMLLPDNEHAAIIPFSLVPNHSLPPNESQVKETTMNALLLEYNIMDQYYKEKTSQTNNGELQEELEQQQRIKNTIISSLSAKETEDYARLETVNFEDQKVLHHNTFKQLYDSNLIRIIPANYLIDNRDPAMKNLHNPNRNLILNQNADHPNKIVYYATQNAFVISERLIKTKKPSTNARLLFVREEDNASNRCKYFYYKQYRVLSKRRIQGYNTVDLRAQNNQFEMIKNPYLVGAIILTVFSGISRKVAISNQGGVRQTVEHKTRNQAEDSYWNLGWADGSEQGNNRRKKRKQSPTDTSVFKKHKPQATAQDLGKEVITHYFRKHPKFDLLISHIYPTYIFDIEKRKFLNGFYHISSCESRRYVRFERKQHRVSRLSAETRIGRELEPGEIVDHNNGNTINDSWDEIAISNHSGNTINTEDSRTGSGHRGIFQRGINLFYVTWTQGHPFEREQRYKSCATFEDAIEFRNLMYAEHMLPQVTDGQALNVAWDTYVKDQQTQIVILQSLITYCQQLQHQSQQQQPEQLIWLQMLSEITEEAFQQQLYHNHQPVNTYILSVYDEFIPILKQKRKELQCQLNQQLPQQLLRGIDPTLLTENETPIHELVQGFGEHCAEFHMPLPIEHEWIVAGDVDWDDDNDNSDNNNDDDNDDYTNDDNDNDENNKYENAEDDVGVETDMSVSNLDDDSIISDISTGSNVELEWQLKSYRKPFRFYCLTYEPGNII